MKQVTYAYADWMIGPERDGEGVARPPLREVECRTCSEQSEASSQQGDTDKWAMEHTGLTGHRTYREVTTAFLVTTPAPTNPLYNEEQP